MDKKNIRFYASLAEIVSALAIIVSLLYAANEFRRAQTLSSREVDVILFERQRAANSALVESSGLAAIVAAAESDPEALSRADRLRYLAYQHNFFDSWELAWSYWTDGILDQPTWREWDAWFTAQARRRPRFGWVENRHHFTGEAFRRHVDKQLSAPAPVAPTE